jgi:hypothetical protein
MSNKKQTAVEWLKKQLEDYGSPSNLSLDWNTLDELCQQAKEMEKDQIKDAYFNGSEDLNFRKRSPTKYFNETYGGNHENNT